MTEDYLVKIKVIKSKGAASLVEYNDAGRYRRVILPRDAIVSKENSEFAESESLEMGMPYGINWEPRLQRSFVISGSRIAELLEVSGIWTKEDYQNNPSIVHQAVLGAAREILTELRGIVHSIPKQED